MGGSPSIQPSYGIERDIQRARLNLQAIRQGELPADLNFLKRPKQFPSETVHIATQSNPAPEEESAQWGVTRSIFGDNAVTKALEGESSLVSGFAGLLDIKPQTRKGQGLSGLRIADNFVNGLLSPITQVFKNPHITLPIMLGGAALMYLFPPLMPVLLASGLTIGLAQVGFGLAKAGYHVYRKEYEEAEGAFRIVGEGTIASALSGMGMMRHYRALPIRERFAQPFRDTVNIYRQFRTEGVWTTLESLKNEQNIALLGTTNAKKAACLTDGIKKSGIEEKTSYLGVTDDAHKTQAILPRVSNAPEAEQPLWVPQDEVPHGDTFHEISGVKGRFASTENILKSSLQGVLRNAETGKSEALHSALNRLGIEGINPQTGKPFASFAEARAVLGENTLGPVLQNYHVLDGQTVGQAYAGRRIYLVADDSGFGVPITDGARMNAFQQELQERFGLSDSQLKEYMDGFKTPGRATSRLNPHDVLGVRTHERLDYLSERFNENLAGKTNIAGQVIQPINKDVTETMVAEILRTVNPKGPFQMNSAVTVRNVLTGNLETDSRILNGQFLGAGDPQLPQAIAGNTLKPPTILDSVYSTAAEKMGLPMTDPRMGQFMPGTPASEASVRSIHGQSIWDTGLKGTFGFATVEEVVGESLKKSPERFRTVQ